MQLATFGGGCFWCIEAVYSRMKGVHSAISGYEGGQTLNPDYRSICTGETGHAEVVQIEFDETVVSYEELLDVFWQIHDPTTLNRQGADVGTQYRSVIFTHTKEQEEIAKSSLPDGAVTQVLPTETFYKAEEYHQDYLTNNPHQGYCMAVVYPKVQKFESIFPSKVKEK